MTHKKHEDEMTSEELLKRVADTLDRWDDYGLLLLRKRILKHLEGRGELMTEETREAKPGMTREPLNLEAVQSFRAYALDNDTESDGSQCQWADYTLRALDELDWSRAEIDRLRAANAELRKIIRETRDEGSAWGIYR